MVGWVYKKGTVSLDKQAGPQIGFSKSSLDMVYAVLELSTKEEKKGSLVEAAIHREGVLTT